MIWTWLGHAMWLCEVEGVRILFDPLLGDGYHDDVFEVVPRRTIHVDALRPDIVVVTHRHPDHFDLPSLHRLAGLDPEVVVLTADAMVGRACKRLGFRYVSVLPDWQTVPLDDGVELLTTPSFTHVVEWGMVVRSRAGAAWNQVDTEMADRAAEVAARMGRLDLALVRWQPLKQVDVLVGAAAGFRPASYAHELDTVAALDVQAIVPGAAGSRVRAAPWLNQFAYPVDEARFVFDLKRRAPHIQAMFAIPGARYVIDGGVHCEEPDGTLLTVLDDADDRQFHPFEVPPVTDPGPPDGRPAVEAWLTDTLLPAVDPTIVCQLEVVWRDRTDVYTLRDGILTRRPSRDWDLHNIVAGSDLADVIAGRAHWGRPLLCGRLRCANRVYTVTDQGLQTKRIQAFFLYAPLSYDAATDRWIEWELDRLTAGLH